MDLYKTCDCLPHDNLIAQFEAHGIGKPGLATYQIENSKKKKVSSSYSDWFDKIRSVLQGSIFSQLIFNLFINDLFLFVERTNICNFADDNTEYRCGSDLEIVLEELLFNDICKVNVSCLNSRY